MTVSMAVPLMERTVCGGCGHFHRPVLAKKRGDSKPCTCCRIDAKTAGQAVDEDE